MVAGGACKGRRGEERALVMGWGDGIGLVDEAKEVVGLERDVLYVLLKKFCVLRKENKHERWKADLSCL